MFHLRSNFNNRSNFWNQSLERCHCLVENIYGVTCPFYSPEGLFKTEHNLPNKYYNRTIIAKKIIVYKAQEEPRRRQV